MKDYQNITPEFIKQLPYTDFVGFINQWNVLPGAYATLSKWAAFSQLGKDSRIIELACTSGFSSRELATITGCSGVGLDLSRLAVEMARYNLETYAPQAHIEYIQQDAHTFSPQEKFSHAIVGAALKFFSDPRKIIGKIISSFLVDGGCLLAAPFYTVAPIPPALIERARSVFGITVTTEKYKEIMNIYTGFEVLYEDRCDLIQETEDELRHYCNSTIDRACSIKQISDAVLRQTMFERLMDIKRMSNDLRPYQHYSVLVLRYRSSVYPHRYAELF